MKKIIFFFIMGLFLINLVLVSGLSASINIPEKYSEVQAGEKFYFSIEIKYPENPSRKDIKLSYEILKDGEIVAQAKVLKAIENQASFMDFIVIPNSAEKGMNIIKVGISDYEDLSKEVEASFNIKSKKQEDLTKYIFMLLGSILLGVILILIRVFLIKKG